MPNYNNRYMYETSPRKLKPEYDPPKKIKRKKNSTLKTSTQKKQTAKAKNYDVKAKSIVYLGIVFAVLFAMGFQNSKINEQFSELKASEKQLATLQKENEQLEVNIENSLNLNNLEQVAKEQLGMQKATTKQTKYVSLPKRDYVELASEQIVKDTDQNWFQRIINWIMNIVK